MQLPTLMLPSREIDRLGPLSSCISISVLHYLRVIIPTQRPIHFLSTLHCFGYPNSARLDTRRPILRIDTLSIVLLDLP